jgi:DNA-binding transcriptional MerR regulator
VTRSLTVAQLARHAGVSPDTIRYYERRGLLDPPPRSASSYRQFDPAAVDRVRFIRAKQRLGLPLKEIERLLAALRERGCAREEARGMLVNRLAEVDRGMAELAALRAQIAAALAELDGAGQ